MSWFIRRSRRSSVRKYIVADNRYCTLYTRECCYGWVHELHTLLLLATMATRFLHACSVARHLVHLKSKPNLESMLLCEDVRSKATVYMCLWKARHCGIYREMSSWPSFTTHTKPLVCSFGSYTYVASHQSGCRSKNFSGVPHSTPAAAKLWLFET